jgi:cadmium resistance protein CadD (predicted permease)
MNTPPTYSTEKAAIQSLTLRSAAVIAVAAAADRLGVVLPEGAAQEIAAALVDLIVTLGLIGVAVGRARARTPIV